MPIEINGNTYDIDRDELRLLIEEDTPAGWIAAALLEADGENQYDVPNASAAAQERFASA